MRFTSSQAGTATVKVAGGRTTTAQVRAGTATVRVSTKGLASGRHKVTVSVTNKLEGDGTAAVLRVRRPTPTPTPHFTG